jgi:hypothetical protein
MESRRGFAYAAFVVKHRNEDSHPTLRGMRASFEAPLASERQAGLIDFYIWLKCFTCLPHAVVVSLHRQIG